MIKITKPIQFDVNHYYTNQYMIDELTLKESNGNEITFKNYSQMANYLGLTRQGLYNKIRANMKPIDKLRDITNKKNYEYSNRIIKAKTDKPTSEIDIGINIK